MNDGAIAPINPATGQPQPVATTTGPSPAPATQQGTTPPPAPTVDVQAVEVRQEPSPIKGQRRDPRGTQPDYDPIQIIFLTGVYRGKSIDLGVGINQISNNQSVAWEARDADGVRVGANFKNISAREFSLSLEYFDLGHDIIHLTENLSHLQEITGDEKTPPMLMLIHGGKNIGPVVCSSLSTQLSEPHSERRGFHYAKVDLSLALYGGKESEHALGKPLTPTPLGDDRATQTDMERQRQGQTEVVELLLANCLGSDGSAEVSTLLESGVTPEGVVELSPNALVQSAIAGIIPPEVLADPLVFTKLAGDLAAVMALNENGVGISINAQAFAEAILTGDTSTLPPDLADQAIATGEDYRAALDAIAAGDLTPLLEPGQRAGEKLRNFGSCGLTLKTTGITATATGGTEATTLTWLNDWAATASDEEITTTLGDIDPERVRNGIPYQSQGEFISFHSDPADGAAAGVAAWQRAAAAAGSSGGEPDNGIPEDEGDLSGGELI